MSDILISYGSAVKALDDGKIGGYAVRFGGKDLTADDFGADTNFGFAGQDTRRVDIMFHHGQPIQTKSGGKIRVPSPIGYATLKMSDDGILIEDAILFNAEQYQKHLDRLGWSTGAAAHTVLRDDSGHIKQWQISEVSLTPTPAEPRNLIAAKSLEVKTDMEIEGEPVSDPEPEPIQAAPAEEQSAPIEEPQPEPVDYRAIGREVGIEVARQYMQTRQQAAG
jgi:hypothetical protein